MIERLTKNWGADYAELREAQKLKKLGFEMFINPGHPQIVFVNNKNEVICLPIENGKIQGVCVFAVKNLETDELDYAKGLTADELEAVASFVRVYNS